MDKHHYPTKWRGITIDRIEDAMEGEPGYICTKLIPGDPCGGTRYVAFPETDTKGTPVMWPKERRKTTLWNVYWAFRLAEEGKVPVDA